MKRGSIMYDIVEGIHKALRIESTWAFVLIISVSFGVVAGLFAWIIDIGYKNSPEYNTAQQLAAQQIGHIKPVPAYPAIDFNFMPEGIKHDAPNDYIPRLTLKIKNRGSFAIQDVRMQATQYTLRNHAIIMALSKIGGAARVARQIAANGGTSAAKSIRDMIPVLHLEPVGEREHGKQRPVSPEENFYALRFTFIDTASQKRYCFYKVISAKPTYLLADESPFSYAWGTMDTSGVARDIREKWVSGPRNVILPDQRRMYESSPEEEYMGSKPLQ
jgi:hypothetical protein